MANSSSAILNIAIVLVLSWIGVLILVLLSRQAQARRARRAYVTQRYEEVAAGRRKLSLTGFRLLQAWNNQKQVVAASVTAVVAGYLALAASFVVLIAFASAGIALPLWLGFLALMGSLLWFFGTIAAAVSASKMNQTMERLYDLFGGPQAETRGNPDASQRRPWWQPRW